MKTNKEILDQLKKMNEVKLFGIRVKNKDIDKFRDLQAMTGLKASDLFELVLETFEEKYRCLGFEEEGDAE